MRRKWSSEMLPVLKKKCDEGMSYTSIGAMLGVAPITVSRWVRRYLPDEFLRRKESRVLWKGTFLPRLRVMCEQGFSYVRIASEFCVSCYMAKSWVKRHFPDEFVRRSVIRGKWREEFLSPLREMCEKNFSYKMMASELGVSEGTIPYWLERYLPSEFSRREVKKKVEWCDDFLPLLRKMCDEGMLYKDIAVFFGVAPPTITHWVKQHLPDVFLQRKETRGKWRKEFLPRLREICEGGGTFQAVGDEFDVSVITARDWVLKHLGEEVFDKVPRKVKVYPPEVRQAAQDMYYDDCSCEEISHALNVDLERVLKWCGHLSLRSGSSDDQDSFGSYGQTVVDLCEEEPTLKDLQIIEKQGIGFL